MSWLPKKKAISFDDYLELTDVSFNWADSYDAKDWSRLRSIIAATLWVDHRLEMDVRWKWDAMSAEKFVEMLSSDGFLGDLLVKKQHLLGATVWEPVSDTEVIGHHLLRAAHLRSTGPDMQHVDR